MSFFHPQLLSSGSSCCFMAFELGSCFLLEAPSFGIIILTVVRPPGSVLLRALQVDSFVNL